MLVTKISNDARISQIIKLWIISELYLKHEKESGIYEMFALVDYSIYLFHLFLISNPHEWNGGLLGELLG